MMKWGTRVDSRYLQQCSFLGIEGPGHRGLGRGCRLLMQKKKELVFLRLREMSISDQKNQNGYS